MKTKIFNGRKSGKVFCRRVGKNVHVGQMKCIQGRNFKELALMVGLVVGALGQVVSGQSVRRAEVQIVVGPNVQVSKAFKDSAHYENFAAGDPDHPGRLISCSMVFPIPNKDRMGNVDITICYVSFDDGKSWEATLIEPKPSMDPAMVYGRNDDLYVANCKLPTTPDYSAIYKSTDGGHKWSEMSRLPIDDREWIAFDRTSSKYAGRLYAVGTGASRTISGSCETLQVFRSLDGGKTFLGPVSGGCLPAGREFTVASSVAVLSDGVLVVMFEEELPDKNREIHIVSSEDGGETFSKSRKIADEGWVGAFSDLHGLHHIPQLAIDPGSLVFKDRLYAVFERIVSDRVQIQLSYSSDKGKTWSEPVTVNDDRSPEPDGKGPDHMLPAVAVNKDGIVLIAWYDRRDAKDNLGWKLRAAASLDGGETFSASVPVTDTASSSPNQSTPWEQDLYSYGFQRDGTAELLVLLDDFFRTGGHTSGLAVGIDGTFHPTWIDYRTGIAQLWSAAVRVTGAVNKNGSADLAELEDISKSVTAQLFGPSLDRATGTLSIKVQLKNTSKETVEGPVKVRVIGLESAWGVLEITNADNGEKGTGAVWDLSKELSAGRLLPMKLSALKLLTFRLSDLRPAGDARSFRNDVVMKVHTRVYGKLRKDDGRDREKH
jgi:hypothetical protein